MQDARGLQFSFHERLVDDHLRSDIGEFTSLPSLHLLSHRLKVALHSVHTNRDAVDERERLGMFREYRGEHAWVQCSQIVCAKPSTPVTSGSRILILQDLPRLPIAEDSPAVCSTWLLATTSGTSLTNSLVTRPCDVLASTNYAATHRQLRTDRACLELRCTAGLRPGGQRDSCLLPPQRETPLHVGVVRHRSFQRW